MIYLAPLSGVRMDLRHPRLGCIVTPQSDWGVPEGMSWAADCGLRVATSTDPSAIMRYLDWLEAARYDRATCLFAVAPDVLGDARATWERAEQLLPRIRGLGYKVALVAQDGFDAHAVDWDAFDVLFIGGRPALTTVRPTAGGRRLRAAEWKRAEDGGYAAIGAAKRHGKRVHVGRVNGGRLLAQLAAAGADSADGTKLVFGPDRHWPLLLRWFAQLDAQPSLPMGGRSPARSPDSCYDAQGS